MATRAQVVAEARSWLGTRYQHQARLKGVATDCAGFVCGVGVAVGLLPADYASRPEALPYAGYPRQAYGGRMAQACALILEPIARSDALPGDILLMKFQDEPQHVALITDHGMIHAHAQMRKVVEHRLDEEWKARIVGAYRYPGIE